MEAELEAVRRAARRSCPLGGQWWQRRTAAALGLEATLRPRGRPRKSRSCEEEMEA
jgi:putative transposase